MTSKILCNVNTFQSPIPSNSDDTPYALKKKQDETTYTPKAIWQKLNPKYKTAFFEQIQGIPFKKIPKIHSNYVAYYWEKSIIYDEYIMIWSKKFQQVIIQCKAEIKG